MAEMATTFVHADRRTFQEQTLVQVQVSTQFAAPVPFATRCLCLFQVRWSPRYLLSNSRLDRPRSISGGGRVLCPSIYYSNKDFKVLGELDGFYLFQDDNQGIRIPATHIMETANDDHSTITYPNLLRGHLKSTFLP